MHKRIQSGLLLSLVAFGACLTALRLVPREPLLLEHARRVADTTQWGIDGQRFNDSIRHHWLSTTKFSLIATKGN